MSSATCFTVKYSITDVISSFLFILYHTDSGLKSRTHLKAVFSNNIFHTGQAQKRVGSAILYTITCLEDKTMCCVVCTCPVTLDYHSCEFLSTYFLKKLILIHANDFEM